MHGFSLRFSVPAVVALGTLLANIASTRADVPPAPPGFASEDEVRSAFFAGKLKLIDLTIAVPDTVSVEKGIEYGKGGDVSLKLDLYRPKQQGKPAPSIIFIHGGAWRKGSRDVYHYYCTKFAERGYVAATISYRLTDVAPYPAAVEDAKCAVRWLRTNAARFGADPNRIAVAGGSAGGHLSMMVGYAANVPELEGTGGHAGTSSRIQAVVNLYGPADLTAEIATSSDEVRKFLGGHSFAEAPQVYQQASPISHITKDDPPTLVLHGSIDSTVPIDQSERLVARLKQVGVEVDYDRLEGWPHTMDAEESVNHHCLAKMAEFFEKHLSTGSGTATGQ